MTTPAANVDSKSSYFPSLAYQRFRLNGTLDKSGTMDFQGAGKANRFIRPASSTSPIRADGSRAPKPWSVRWGKVEPPVRSVSYFGPDAQFPSVYRRYWVGSCPVLGTNNSPSTSYADLLADAGGVPWIKGLNNSFFPIGVRNAAITKLRLKVIDDKAQWGVTLAEAAKTVDGIRQVSEQILGTLDFLARGVKRQRQDVATFLFKGYWPVRKGRPWSEKRRIQAGNQVTSGWLQFQLGIRPLLQDIEQSGEAVSWLVFDQKQPLRFTVRAGHSEKSGVVWKTSFPRNYYTEYYADCHQPLEVEVECHYSITYSLRPTTTTTFQQLGLTNLAAVAWELVWGSWMVDYVVQVGDWISSMVEIDGLYDVEGSCSMKATVKSADAPVQIHPIHPGGAFFGVSNVVTSYEVGRFERTTLTSLPAPALLPSVRNKLDVRRMANVLAVLSQLASR